MSVASKNPFALLNDDEDDGRKSGAVKTKDDKPVVTDQAKANAVRKPQSTRGGRYYQRGGGTKPATTTPAVDSADPTSPTGDKRNYRGDRGDRGGRGDRGDRPPRGDRGERGERGRGRGGRGRGRGGDRPDRHSATGITDSQKKVHQGWGGDRGESELKDETAGAADANAGDAWGAAPAGDAWDAPAPAAGEGADPWADTTGGDAGATGENKDDKPAEGDEGRRKKRFDDEEDEGKMTLDEYRAKQGEGETIPKLELRQANEGASDLFKGAKQLLKDPEADSYFVGKQAKTGTAPKARKEGKQYIEIDARFDPPARGRGRGRGDRGGGFRGNREGGGGGGYRGDRGNRNRSDQQQVSIDDTSAFPALS